MHHRHFKRVGATALLAIAGLLGSLLIAPAAPAATINACQAKKGGTIRIVSSKTKCKKTEKKITWSTTGPAGKNGTNGSNGSNGTNGTNGAAGATGAAGQPQKAFAFNVTSDTGGLLSSTKTDLFTTNGVTVTLNCFNFLANFIAIEATGPAGTTAGSGMIATRTDNTATQAAQQSVYDVSVTTGTTFGSLGTNTSGLLSNKAQFDGQIQTAGAVIAIHANLLVGPSPTACVVKGIAFAIPA